MEAIKRSANLLKKTWGEQIVGNFGVGIVFGLLSFLVKMLSYPVRLVQSGYVQQYALVILAGVAIGLGYYLMK